MSEDTRAAFEAWYIARQRARGYGKMLADAEFVGRHENGKYSTLGLEDAFEAWQASRAAALEEAAKACESQSGDEDMRAEAIRSLASEG